MLTRKRACAWEANLFLALLWLGRRGKKQLMENIYNNKTIRAYLPASVKGMDMGSVNTSICRPA